MKGLFQLVPVGAGVICAIFGATLLYDSYLFQDGATETMGRVTHVDCHKNSEGVDTCKPTFLFEDQSGALHKARTDDRSTTFDFAVGDETLILYNFDVSANVKVSTPFGIWGVGAIFFGFGLLLAGTWFVSLMKVFAGRKERPPVETEGYRRRPDRDAGAGAVWSRHSIPSSEQTVRRR